MLTIEDIARVIDRAAFDTRNRRRCPVTTERRRKLAEGKAERILNMHKRELEALKLEIMELRNL